jgi:hypothetical protein
VWDFFVPSLSCPARATAIYFELILYLYLIYKKNT